MSEEVKQSRDRQEDDAGKQPRQGVGRRDILQGLSALPVLGLFGYAVKKQIDYENARLEARTPPLAPASRLSEINVALVGAGDQGEVLLNAMLKIPGLRFRAICDIWTEYNQRKLVSRLKKFNFEVNGYEDYREMLDKERDLDAVVIATPDFWHARQTIDCLHAGKHVYCEKEMSNTLEGARSMVIAARETGKLLQIGHQRRSNPRYLHCYERLLREAKLLGRIVTAQGQWNRSVKPDIGWPQRYTIPEERLRRYGFQSMHQFRNWRWYKGLGGGPIVDLGSHQIDIFNWFLDATPSHVLASGGTDYYDPATHEWYDTVLAIYEYQTAEGRARAFYKTQTTNGSQGYFEVFMGDQGTLVISESEAAYSGSVYREVSAPAWDDWVRKVYIAAPNIQAARTEEVEAVLDVRESVSPDEHRIPIQLTDPYHKPHLENFFNAIRGTAKLNCPAEVGFETAVTVLKVNEAIETGQKMAFRPEDFKV
jgi:predicted dehydrogenase